MNLSIFGFFLRLCIDSLTYGFFLNFFSNLLNLPDIEFFLLKVSASRSQHLTLMYDNALTLPL